MERATSPPAQEGGGEGALSADVGPRFTGIMQRNRALTREVGIGLQRSKQENKQTRSDGGVREVGRILDGIEAGDELRRELIAA